MTTARIDRASRGTPIHSVGVSGVSGVIFAGSGSAVVVLAAGSILLPTPRGGRRRPMPSGSMAGPGGADPVVGSFGGGRGDRIGSTSSADGDRAVAAVLADLQDFWAANCPRAAARVLALPRRLRLHGLHGGQRLPRTVHHRTRR